MQQEMHGGDNGDKKPKKQMNPIMAAMVQTGKNIRADSHVKKLLAEKKLANKNVLQIGGMILKEAKKNVAEKKKVSVDELKGSNPDVIAEYKMLDKKAAENNYKKYVDPLVAANAKQMSRVGRKFNLQMY